jgi:hypothetical protein
MKKLDLIEGNWLRDLVNQIKANVMEYDAVGRMIEQFQAS